MPQPRTSNCAKCSSAKIVLRNGSSRCPTCHNRRGREYYQQSALRRSKMRRSYVLRRYGTALEDLEQILREQDGCCAICRLPWQTCVPAKQARYETTFLQHLCIDHDHRDGKVRGLLCNACNTAIGLFGEDERRLGNAIAYLRHHRRLDGGRLSEAQNRDSVGDFRRVTAR